MAAVQQQQRSLVLLLCAAYGAGSTPLTTMVDVQWLLVAALLGETQQGCKGAGWVSSQQSPGSTAVTMRGTTAGLFK
jgi:hypothetical protein